MSTRTALTVVGGVVGAYFGYPQLGLVIGGLVGGIVDPQKIQGPQIGEVAFQTSAEGVPRPIIYGSYPVYGNIIQQGPVIKVEDEGDTGKGGPEQGAGDKVYRTYAIRICEGPIAGVLRIWADNKLVYDVRQGSQMLAESTKWIENKTLYLGGEDQLPDPNLVVLNSDTPSYRGTAYIVFVMEDLSDRGGSYPQYRFEVASALDSQELERVYGTDLGPIGVGNGAPTGPTAPGQGGGAVWLPGGGSSAIGTPGSGGLLMNGNTYLASWRFQSRDIIHVECWIKLDGGKIFTQTVYLDDGEFQLIRAQVNLVPGNGHTLEIGFTAIETSQGFFTESINRLNTSTTYDPLYDDDEPPYIYLPDHIYFGLITDGSDIYSAGPVLFSLGYETEWGPDTFIVNEGQPVPLSDIVADIHDRCGVDSSFYDVSELTDLVAGVGFSGYYTGADCITPLRTAYFFDKSEHDKKLWYPKRGAAVIETLTIDDLTEFPDNTTRSQAIEFPVKLHLEYQHAISGYAKVKATAASSSPDILTTGEATVQVPVVLNEDQAAQTVDKMYKVTRAEAVGTTEIKVPIDIGAKYVAGNCIGLALRGKITRNRIDTIDFAADWTFKFTLKADRQSAYTSDLTGVPIPPPTLPPSTIVGETIIAVLDIAARTETEDDLNYLVAVTGAAPPWYGARYRRSFDGGATYSTVEDITTASIMGEITNSVADASEYFTDTTNVVNVILYREGQSISSITENELLSEGGAFALEKADGSWEIMQYRDAVEESDGSFTLSTLHRGQGNSKTSSHAAGDKLVMLTRPSHINAQSAWIGMDLTHQAITLGSSADDTVNEVTQTYVGRSQIEWPVASLELERATNNISGTWAPRYRFGTANSPIASINMTGFRVTIDDGSISDTFDLPLSQPFFSNYDASAMSSPVTVTVGALNRITGEGETTSDTV